MGRFAAPLRPMPNKTSNGQGGIFFEGMQADNTK